MTRTHNDKKPETTASVIQKEFRKLGDNDKASILRKFFKTGPGQYGEGDIFLGITVPRMRQFAKQYAHIPISQIKTILHSPYHEERLLALAILTVQFPKGTSTQQNAIYDLYLSNTRYINNWDLIDLSAHKIVGPYLTDKPKDILLDLARSASMWERRIAIISTFHYIRNNEFEWPFRISDVLLQDKEDLIHKAVGWMLREIGKRDQKAEENFLLPRYRSMPRTMLRYAIERFSEKRRLEYLKGTTK